MASDLVRMRTGALIFGLVQGLLLLLAQIFVEHGLWPASEIGGRFAWYSVALAVPTLLVLAWDGGSARRLAQVGAGLAVTLALLGAWSGEQTGSHSNTTAVLIPYFLTLAVGWYVFLPFAQIWQRSGRWQFPYPQLFEHSWNNAFTLAIAAGFTALFRGLLSLWAGLFQVVGIEFFQELFSSRYFNYPVLTTVFAFALYLARRHVQAVNVARRIVLTVFRLLLPLLAFIALLFLAELPFSGLAPLWRTGFATPLMLALIVLMIVFVNAVVQDGSGKPPYHRWLRRLVEAAVLLLPVYVGLAGYSLGLRVAQHGWSVDRFWGMLLVGLGGLYAFGYALAVWRRRGGAWPALVGRINVGMALVVLALAVLVNSPLLDARRIAVASQTARLLDGRIGAEQFDYRYLRFELGRAGEQALAELQRLERHAQAAQIRERAGAILEQRNPWEVTPEALASDAQVLGHLRVYPPRHAVDPGFLAFLRRQREDYTLRGCFARGQRCLLLALDLNRDRRSDYVLIQPPSQYSADETLLLFSHELDGWARRGRLHGGTAREARRGQAELERLLERGDYRAVVPGWEDLQLGGRTYRLQDW
jgi:hypothetical protein